MPDHSRVETHPSQDAASQRGNVDQKAFEELVRSDRFTAFTLECFKQAVAQAVEEDKRIFGGRPPGL